MVTEALAEFRGIETRFGRREVHKGIDLAVERGEVLTLLGGSGSGKSTLLRMLVGLETPSAGSCLFEGKKLETLAKAEWSNVRRKVAYAFQNGALFDSLTVLENLSYPLEEHTDLTEEEREARVMQLLARFGMEDAAHNMPAELSGGMQKRVGLARAIVLDPELVLYDEPTAGLDPANGRKIEKMILDLKASGKTALLVTHDTWLARQVSDRLAMIVDGRIAALQTRGEFARAPAPALKAYFDGELDA